MYYETAFVFDASDELRLAVMRLRQQSILSNLANRQARPHLTILFLGFPDAGTLALLEKELRNPPFESLEVPLSGVDCFETHGIMTNLHLLVEPIPQLKEIHDWARSRCEVIGWQPPQSYVGTRYIPHITIFGNINEPLETMEAFAQYDLPTSARLEGMELRTHPAPA